MPKRDDAAARPESEPVSAPALSRGDHEMDNAERSTPPAEGPGGSRDMSSPEFRRVVDLVAGKHGLRLLAVKPEEHSWV